MTDDTIDPTRHIIVDTDTGIDDALALLYLAGHPQAEISAITSVFGNTTVDHALTNIARVLEVAGLEDILVARGAAGPISGTSKLASHVHGTDGLGDLWSTPATPKNMSDLSSAQLLVEMARSRPGYYDLLPLGPFSNVALALEIEPNLLTLFRSVVVMGGSGDYAPPGTFLMVDANVQSDGVAAERMFAAPRKELVMVGINVTAHAIVDEAHVESLRTSGSPWGEFSAQVLEPYMDFTQYSWGRRISAAHDGLTAGLLMHPEWITRSVDGPVNVTRDGFATRAYLMQTSDGNPVCWETYPAPDTKVVLDTNHEAFVADFVRILSQK